MSERTYTESEHQQAIQLERAAIVREAAVRRCEWCARNWDFDVLNQHSKGCPCHWCRQPEDLKLAMRPRPTMHVNEDRSIFHICDSLDILAIPTDQPALDRHDALKDLRITELEHVLETSDMEFQAQTAALLEKADEYTNILGMKLLNIGVKSGWNICDDIGHAIRALIPASAAAALEERERKARIEEAEWWYEHPHYLHPFPTDTGDQCMHAKRLAELRAEQGAKQP